MRRALPPDPDRMNELRAEWAGECIEHMAEITGCEGGKEAAGDLLCNYFHWCDRQGIDMEALFAGARSCYLEEIRED